MLAAMSRAFRSDAAGSSESVLVGHRYTRHTHLFPTFMATTIRPEVEGDAQAIEAVTVAAFDSAPHSDHTEQFVVRALRDAGALPVSLVAERRGAIVGHVAVSPVRISDGSMGWYGLGPICVAPSVQRQGIGSRLVEAALDTLERLSAEGCVLLGDPGFHARFGFVAADTLELPGVPPAYFQALAFRGSAAGGIVSYHAAFEAKA